MNIDEDYSFRFIETREEYEKYVFKESVDNHWDPSHLDYDIDKSICDFKNLRLYSYRGVPFMTCSFLIYEKEKMIFWGNYVCFSEFRSKKISFPIFKKHFDEFRNQGYDFFLTTDSMEKLYNERLELKTYYKFDSFRTIKRNIELDEVNSNIISENIDIRQLFQYDYSVCHLDRSSVLKKMTEIDQIKIFVSLNDEGCINGYCILKPTVIGYGYLPLIADSYEIAKDLINASISHEFLADDSEVMIDALRFHQNLIEYLNNKKWKYDMSIPFLGSKRPLFDEKKVFSIFSYQQTQ